MPAHAAAPAQNSRAAETGDIAMSRTQEALAVKQEEQQMKQQQEIAITTPPTVPAELMDEYDRFRQAAAENTKTFLMGHVLKFKKGKWLCGAEKAEIADHTRFVALMNEACHGWLRWNADKTATHRDVGKIAEGWKLPDKDMLPDRDPEQWPIGLSGKKEDPWRTAIYLPLASLDGETVVTFATTTPTGANAFWKLASRYAWLGRKHPGQYPIVEIEASGYTDPRYDWVDVPSFKIIDWVGRPDLPQLTAGGTDNGGGDSNTAAAAEPTLQDEMDDAIPF
jgi:hypothetical protein